MKYLSLFSGIGGFELGIEKAYERILDSTTSGRQSKSIGEGVEHNENSSLTPSKSREQIPTCIGFSEIDKYAIQIYQKHFNHTNYGDITKINVQELPDFDLLVGGFPCQAFSIAGKRRGFDDTRGTLFFDIARILKEKRPRNFILENVKGLLSHDNGRTFKTIISTLVELGYCVEWQVLNAKNFGVPQNRERVFIVGHLGGIPEQKVFPIGTQPVEDTRRTGQEVSYTIDANYAKGTNTITKGRRQVVYNQYNNRVMEKTCGTLGTCNSRTSKQGYMVSDFLKIRRLTPVECERLMGYPDNWTEGLSDTQRYKTLGNGIVSNVVAEVVKRLFSYEDIV